jgi:hypothetical protein
MSQLSNSKNGFLTDEELKIFNYLKQTYSLMDDSKFRNHKFEITNAIHLIQLVFMWRAMIRLNNGEFWVKFQLPYERHEALRAQTINSQYQTIIRDLLKIYDDFQLLDNYHPSHLDDITRGINQLFDIINKVESS